MNQTITQSVSIGDSWDSAAFSKLLAEQAKANDTAIKSLESSMARAGANQQQLQEQIAQSGMMKDIRDVLLKELQDRKIHEETEKLLKIQERKAQQIQNHLKREIELKKEVAEESARLNKLRADESKAIAQMAKGMQTFETLGDKFSNMGKKLKDNFGSMSSLKVTALKAFNVGGIFNKSIAKEKFIQTQRKLGSEDDRSTLAGKFETANRAAKDIKKNEAEISQLKKDTGMSESDLAKRGAGKELFAKRNALSDTLAGSDLRAASIKTTPTQAHAESGADEERAIEAEKHAQKQEELFVKIEQNTRGESPDQKAKPKEEGSKGGGLLSGLLGGGKVGKALEGMKNFGIGLVAISAGLWIAAEAFKNFGDVDWDSIGKGMVVLGGMVLAAIGLDKVKGSILKGAMVLGVLGLAVWGIGEAFKTFGDLDWETIGKGMAAVVGLGVIAAVMGTFIVPMALGAAALLGLGAALWVVGEAMQAVGQGFDDLQVGLEKLAQLDGANLLMVAAGVAALGAAMVAFGAGSAVAGVSNLVTGFLSGVTGQKTPVEQLIDIGNAGDGISKAGSGMTSLASAMKAFGEVKGDSLKAMKQFPWEEATKFVAAGGAMSVDGGKVYNASKSNADSSAASSKSAGGGTTVVNAPVNNSSKSTNVMKPQIRNQESSVNSWLRSKFI